MALLKDSYDIGKDLLKGGISRSKIIKTLILEIKLNLKFLSDFSKKNYQPDAAELLRIIPKLKVDVIELINKSDFPTNSLSNRKVTQEILGSTPAPRILGNDLDTLLDKVYLMISYIKQDYDKKGLNLFVRLKNIYNYSRISLKLLEKK
jgi:hypothetical protein